MHDVISFAHAHNLQPQTKWRREVGVERRNFKEKLPKFCFICVIRSVRYLVEQTSTELSKAIEEGLS